jgi:FtsZ-interacting cell division protein ZipA
VLARITYGLVIVAVGTLIGGFFTQDSNALLFISIGLSVAAIALVLVGWARRAKEAPVGFDEDLAFEEEELEEDDEALLGALDDDELAYVEERPGRRKPKAKTKAKSASRSSKPKAKAKTTTSRAKSTASRKSTGGSKAKTTRKTTKRKPPRRSS